MLSCFFLFAVITTTLSAPVPGYDLTNVIQHECGLEGTLLLRSGSKGPYGGDIKELRLELICETQHRARIKISDPNNPRWEVPNVAPPPKPGTGPFDYSFSVTNSPFSVKLVRKTGGKLPLLDTTPGKFNGLIFEDQYIEWTTQVPAQPNIFGLGERKVPLRLLPGKKYSIWAYGPTGTEYMTHLYGHHPFYMELRAEDGGLAHGVFMLNSNAMDVDIGATYPGALSFKMIGGVIDLFVFTGPTPEAVTQQYHQLIGLPFMPPAWALGWHQSKWGYYSAKNTEKIVTEYRKNFLPLDGIWNDIEYMQDYMDFTLDRIRFSEKDMAAFLGRLHASGQHYVFILDPGIHTRAGYEPYERGNRDDIWIKNKDGKALVNMCWPGKAVFPDWTHPNTSTYWSDMLDDLHKKVDFSGLWLDMNEPCTFCDGECPGPRDAEPAPAIPGLYTPDSPPYVPGGRRLDSSTLSLSARHWGGTLHYDLHSLYGFDELRLTEAWMRRAHPTRRPFILCRSTFPGAGKYGAHWTGDNDSSFEDLYYSIPTILTMNMFGIPFTGADICGFRGDSNEELCTRWMALGAFYPFARNHNSLGARTQEPYAFSAATTEISRTMLLARYRLLPLYYTAFWQAHQQGGTVAQPLFFLDPADFATYSVDTQFLIAQTLLVSPVLARGANTTRAYFPAGRWYDYWTGSLAVTGPAWEVLSLPIDTLGLHVRGGSVVPMQEPALTTLESRRNPYALLVALAADGTARGSLHLDGGGWDEASAAPDDFLDMVFEVEAGTLVSRRASQKIPMGEALPLWADLEIGEIEVWGLDCLVTAVTMGGQPAPFSFGADERILTIDPPYTAIGSPFSLTWTCQ